MDERLDQVVPDNPNIPSDAIAITSLQFSELVTDSKCCEVKIHQRGEPPGGYHRRMAGLIAWAGECVMPLFYMWMVNSESTTQIMYGTFKILRRCPDYADQLQGFTMDVACQIAKHARAKLRDLPKGAAIRPMYEKFLSLSIFVDKFHFKNHSPKDTLCMECHDPELYPDLTTACDTEACEQLFRWLSRFKLMVNHQSVSKATLFVASMFWLHAERAIVDGCEDTGRMSNELLGEMRAAYDLAPYDRKGSEARSQLAQRLLAGTHRCSLVRLEQWRLNRPLKRQKAQP